MPIGPLIRKSFGPFEHSIAEAYRRFFVDLDQLASQISIWVPSPARILEVGCGEGAMSERLVAAFPRSEIIAIDISARAGRLFRGPSSHIQFVQTTAQEIAALQPASFDLVLLADVIHHVPHDERIDLLSAIRRCLAPGGVFIFKDWARTRTPVFFVTAIIERYITGDKVEYCTPEELFDLARAGFSSQPLRHTTVRPWRNNLVMEVRRLI